MRFLHQSYIHMEKNIKHRRFQANFADSHVQFHHPPSAYDFSAELSHAHLSAGGLCVWVSDLMGTYGFHKPLHMGDDQPHMKQFPVGAKSFDWAAW